MPINSGAPIATVTGAATIIDVAKAAEVSISTVSRVINDYVHVRPELRLRVQEAMEALFDDVRSGRKRFVPYQSLKLYGPRTAGSPRD